MAQTSKIGSHATTVRKLKHGGLSVVYHNTEVVCYYPSHLAMPGELVLDTGGWDTATTRLRMNQASNQYNLGYKVYRKKGVTTDYLLGV